MLRASFLLLAFPGTIKLYDVVHAKQQGGKPVLFYSRVVGSTGEHGKNLHTVMRMMIVTQYLNRDDLTSEEL